MEESGGVGPLLLYFAANNMWDTFFFFFFFLNDEKLTRVHIVFLVHFAAN